MLPVVGRFTVKKKITHYYIFGICSCPNLLIHDTSDSVRGIALELTNDGIPGLDQARTIPKIMKDSEAEAAAPI